MIQNLLAMLKPYVWILAPSLWAVLIAYLAWYITKAKNYAPISAVDARTLWHIHRQNTGCVSKKWRKLKRGQKVIGFECDCGYKHLQKRLIAMRTPVAPVYWKHSSDRLQIPRKSTRAQ